MIYFERGMTVMLQCPLLVGSVRGWIQTYPVGVCCVSAFILSALLVTTTKIVIECD